MQEASPDEEKTDNGVNFLDEDKATTAQPAHPSLPDVPSSAQQDPSTSKENLSPEQNDCHVADTSGSPRPEGKLYKQAEGNSIQWTDGSPSELMDSSFDRKIKLEDFLPDTSANSHPSSLEEQPSGAVSTTHIKKEAEAATADAAVESTSQSPPIPSSQFKVESGEAECAQPDAKKYDNSVVDGIMVPSCSSTEPTSTVHIVHVNGDRSDALGPEEPSSSTPAEPSMPLTRLCFSGESIHIPTVLSDDEELLRSVLSKETFKSLPKESQTALKKFLPKSENDDFEDILDCVFTDDKNFCFGNTLSKLVYKLKCNWFSPDRPCEELQLRDNRRVMYDHFHRHYYISTLRKLLVSRHRILEKVSELSGSEEGEIRLKTYGGFLKRKQMVDGLQERTKRRCQVMLNDVRKKVGESDLSSDDEDDGFLKARFIPNNSGKAAGKSTLFSNDFVDIDLHQPLALGSPVGMLKEYVRLKEKEPDCMSLDISDIAVDEVYDRSGVSIISERNFATLVRKRKQAVEEKCEADSSTDVRTNGRLFNNQSRGSNTPHSHSVEDDDEGRASVSCSDLDQDGHDIPDTSSVMSVNGIHSDDSDETDDEERQFEESLRRTEEANNLGSAAQSPAPS